MMWLKLNDDGTPSVEGLSKPYCYHIDQFSRVPADHPQGDRVRPGDGPRHDPGRPRGRAGPARAELQLRPRRGHGRQPHDLPPDLPPGRARDAAPSRASCPSRSWACRPTAATTTSRCGAATRTCSCPRPTTSGCRARSASTRSAACSSTSARSPRSRASTVNSYRRLWDTGFWAPVFADWGFQNRTTALRVSAPGRFEYRSVDSAVNPYLSLAR